jgi:transcription initiation factor IIE alpha subunit
MWSKDLVPHCPSCSSPLTSYGQYSTAYGFGSVWGFKCIKCDQLIIMTDDEGTTVELREAKRVLAANVTLERPEPDADEMRILTMLSKAETSAEEITNRLNLRSERVDYYLIKLRKRGYVTEWFPAPTIASSRSTMYRLCQNGREFLVTKKLL